MATTGALTLQPNTNTSIGQRNPSPATPQTNNARIPQEATTATPSPGRWRHPSFDEISRRQKANTFDQNNVQRIIYNTGFIIALLLLRRLSQSNSSTLSLLLSPPTQSHLSTTLLLSLLLPLFNIALALSPLYKTPDTIPDIPLTPSQRALLGLDPTATPPPTPGTQYITPPRYPTRSSASSTSTPRSNRSSTNSAPSFSLTKVQSPESPSYSGGKRTIDSINNSPFSPSASPLWQKGALGGSSSGRDGTRRGSFGLLPSSPLGRPGGKNESLWGATAAPGTPSPVTGKQGGASVGLNNRWLYRRQGRVGSGRVVA
ncbi:MAG: hypothetical protein Q9219_004365 [cf. Caloplaca sp. 3 TL-2023]